MNISALKNNINLSQYSKMKHTIGFAKQGVKHNKITLFRNFYATSSPSDIEELDKLLMLGVVARREVNPAIGEGFVYRITDLGIDLISYIEEVEIIKGDWQ